MSEHQNGPSTPRKEGKSGSRRHPLLILLAVLLWCECALLAAVTSYLVVELFVAVPDSYPSALAILVLAALATVWLGILAINSVRGASWIRGGAVFWQVLQIAIAIGSFQGLFARADVGWLLLVPAVLVLVLLFTPPVLAATTRPER